jgi:hypothetical protein
VTCSRRITEYVKLDVSLFWRGVRLLFFFRNEKIDFMLIFNKHPLPLSPVPSPFLPFATMSSSNLSNAFTSLCIGFIGMNDRFVSASKPPVDQNAILVLIGEVEASIATLENCSNEISSISEPSEIESALLVAIPINLQFLRKFLERLNATPVDNATSVDNATPADATPAE